MQHCLNLSWSWHENQSKGNIFSLSRGTKKEELDLCQQRKENFIAICAFCFLADMSCVQL